jgi:hypothetical protein
MLLDTRPADRLTLFVTDNGRTVVNEFHRCPKPIAAARNGFDQGIRLRVVVEGSSYLANTKVKSLFEIDESAFTPEMPLQLLTRYEMARTAYEI